MNIGVACAIFEQIESDKYTEQEKLLAMHMVLQMPTHNGITKKDIITALKWLYNLAVVDVEE